MPMPDSKIYVIILDWSFSVEISVEKWLAHFTIGTDTGIKEELNILEYRRTTISSKLLIG